MSALVAAAVATPASAVAPGGPAAPRPDFDARAGDRAAIPTATAAARASLEKALGPQAAISADPVTGGLRTVGRTDGALTGPSRDDAATIAMGYVRAHATAFGLDAHDLASLQLDTRTTTPDGVTHLTYRQLDGGIAAYDSALTAAVGADGRLVTVGGAPAHDLDAPSSTPPLGPAAARAAAQRDLGVTPDGDPGRVGAGAERDTDFANGDHAALVTLADPDGDRLAWKVTAAGPDPYVFEVLVDAASGAVLARHSLTDFLASKAAVVGLRPGTGAAPQTDIGGWLTDATKLSGPYAHVYPDRDDNDAPDAEVLPSAGSDFLFPQMTYTPAGKTCPSAFGLKCTWDGSTSTSIAANASVTANVGQVAAQVFYYVNTFHDWLAQAPISFTGAISFANQDPVDAEVDDGGGFNNANMSTPGGDLSPSMQMYLFTSPAVNGGDDATVVYHEYTHGLTNRLVGGDGQANGLLARQSQAMGEGWSDWYALDYLTEQHLIDDTAAPGDELIGAYVTNNTQTGIRYNAVDCPVGASSSHCPGTSRTGAGGFTFGDLGRVDGYDASHPAFEVHSDGEIWAETLWDLRAAIGGADARGLVTEALRLSPKQPSFLDMRDAILQADVLAGGAHHDAIWQVFAHRGMGYSASTASANATHAVEAFDLPPVAAAPGAPDVAALALEQTTTVTIPIKNPSAGALTGVHATLSAASGGVSVPQSAADLGTIAAGDTATATFQVRVSAAAGCGSVAATTLTLGTDQGAQSFPISIPVGSGRAGAVTRSYATPAPIADGAPAGGLVSTLNVGTHGRVGALRVTLAAYHPWIGDLHAWLTSPSGTTVDLMERPGDDPGPWFSSANFASASPLILDDAAANGIQDVANTNQIISGAWKPNEPLARFAGEDRYGTWTLRITDNYKDTPASGGTLSSWSLETADPTCAITDAPTGLTNDAGTFTARIDPGTAPGTTAAFQLGATSAYGAQSPATALTAGGGLQTVTVSTGGLTPGATYHVRAVALRNGVVVAAGADQAFVAGSTVGASRGVAGDATTGGGSDQSIQDGATGGGGGTTTGSGGSTTTTTAPAPTFTVPKATLTALAKTVRLDRKGRFVLSFRATPGTARGTLTLRYGATAAGSKTFTVPSSGRVKITVGASTSLRSALRRKSSVKTKVTFRIGVTSFTATLTIKPYKKPKARH